MRVLVDIGDAEIKALDQIAKNEKVSRASLVRKAVGDFLQQRSQPSDVDAFGLWGDQFIDGLVYQKQMRDEW